MEQLTLTTPALLFCCFAYSFGLYQPLSGLCFGSANPPCYFQGKSQFNTFGTDTKPAQTPALNTNHADPGNYESVALRAMHVFDLCTFFNLCRNHLCHCPYFTHPFTCSVYSRDSNLSKSFGSAVTRYGVGEGSLELKVSNSKFQVSRGYLF